MNQSKGGLGVWLSVPRSEYVKGEDIVVCLSLRNASAGPLTINSRCAMRAFPGGLSEATWEVDFAVKYENQPCPRFGALIQRRPLNDRNFVALDGGSEYKCDYTVSRYFVMDQPGDYDIQAVYQNGHGGLEYGLAAWTGEIVSNTIRVRMVG